MVRRRIQLQEAPKKPSQIFLRVNLVLQNHLNHRMPEIQVRIVRILLHRHALAAAPPEPSERDRSSGFRLGVGEGRWIGVWGGEAVVGGFDRGLWFEVVEEVRELRSANVEIDGEGSELEISPASRHCCCRWRGLDSGFGFEEEKRVLEFGNEFYETVCGNLYLDSRCPSDLMGLRKPLFIYLFLKFVLVN